MKLPQVCCTCNQPTWNYVKLSRSRSFATANSGNRRSSGEPTWPLYFAFGLFFGLLADLFHKTGTRAGHFSLRVQVPQCKGCVAAKKIEPTVVDLEHCRLGIIVDRRFADAVRDINRPQLSKSRL
jgi:hypothetical protein